MLGVRKWGNDGHCMRLGGWLVRTGTGLDAATLHSERIVLTATVAAADGGEETDHGDDGVGTPCTREVRRVVTCYLFRRESGSD